MKSYMYGVKLKLPDLTVIERKMLRRMFSPRDRDMSWVVFKPLLFQFYKEWAASKMKLWRIDKAAERDGKYMLKIRFGLFGMLSIWVSETLVVDAQVQRRKLCARNG